MAARRGSASLLEASGVADPSGIAFTFVQPNFRDRIRLDSITCVVDAEGLFVDNDNEALTMLKLRQIGFADLVIGAPWADPNGNDGAGESYVVFGGSGVGGSGSPATNAFRNAMKSRLSSTPSPFMSTNTRSGFPSPSWSMKMWSGLPSPSKSPNAWSWCLFAPESLIYHIGCPVVPDNHNTTAPFPP